MVLNGTIVVMNSNQKHFFIDIDETEMGVYEQAIKNKFPHAMVDVLEKEDIIHVVEMRESMQEVVDHQLGIQEIPRDPFFS